MAWKTKVTLAQVTDGNKTAYITLGTKEIAHVHCSRDDGGTTDGMTVEVWGSIDGGTTTGDIPLMELQVAASDTDIDFTVFGVQSFAIGVRRTSGSTDSVSMVPSYVLDNGLVA